MCLSTISVGSQRASASRRGCFSGTVEVDKKLERTGAAIRLASRLSTRCYPDCYPTPWDMLGLRTIREREFPEFSGQCGRRQYQPRRQRPNFKTAALTSVALRPLTSVVQLLAWHRFKRLVWVRLRHQVTDQPDRVDTCDPLRLDADLAIAASQRIKNPSQRRR
jgi:hypothetical protein